MLKSGEEWQVTELDDSVQLTIKTINGERLPTPEELQRAANYLNEQNVYAVRIYCRNEACKDKGSWIMRSVEDIKKTVYPCEVCRHPMVR